MAVAVKVAMRPILKISCTMLTWCSKAYRHAQIACFQA